jgi:hypothetical protein
MPRELSRMVSEGAWVPADVREWVALIDEIEIQHLEMLTAEILHTALDAPAVRLRAAGLLARAGDSSALHALFRVGAGRSGAEAETPPEPPFEERGLPGKIALCEVWGGSRDRVFISLLEPALEDQDERVRAAALVAQARLGHAPALRIVTNVVVGDPALVPDDAPSEPAILEMLLRTGHDGATIGVLEDMLPQVERETKLRVATLLALKGKLSAREALRQEYGEGSLREHIGVDTVRALGKYANADDLRLFAELTYQPEDRDLNVELALALFEHGDSIVMPLVDEALWHGAWDLSILAGALMIEYGGLRRLLDEAESPPPEASTADLRRVGFAIGEWGGLDALAELERRRRSVGGDPVVMGAMLGALSTRTQ